jgi:hypothetical protein
VSTEFNYVARLDTTQIMSGIAEIRSQVGMAFASPTGFQSPAMSIQGGGFSGMNNVASASAAQFQQMFSGMSAGQSMFGGTHTNPAMAYSPHYGMNQAETSLQEEWQVHRGGLAAAAAMKPPGVSAGAYAIAVESNFVNRQLEANHAASMAAQSSFYAGVGGLAAGEAASAIAAPIGAYAGGKLATRFFGAGAAGAGKMLGGLAASWMAFDYASDYVGGKIEQHYADIEQTMGVTRELGELAGAGRGLKRTQQVELGIAAREAAKSIGMDVQEMGDVLALGRQAGMLPTATDPGKAKQQYAEFARAIEEGAQVLQTSLAGATQVIKAAAQHGMSAQEGIIRAAGAGGADAWLAQQARMSAFGSAGASVGMSMGYTAAQGSAMFTGSLGSGAAAGLSGDEMRIMGGRFGAAQFVGTTQMAMAASPMGNLQLMAAMGGGLGGASMMDLPGAAMEGLMAGGGDFVSNALRFQVHQNEYRRGIGAGGIRTMARQQIEMGAELIASMAPELSMDDARRAYAQSMGMNPDQAKLLAGGGAGGGGGGGRFNGMSGEEIARAGLAMQESRLTGSFAAPELERGPRSFGLGYTVDGAMTGAMIAGPKGAAVGAAIGFVAGNLGALQDLGGQLFGDGPGLFASSQEKADYYLRKQAEEYERRMTAAKSKLGYMDVTQGGWSRFVGAPDLGGARLTLGGQGSGAINMTEMSISAMGLKPVAAGAGTIKINDNYYSAKEVQALSREPMWTRQPTDQQTSSASMAAVEVAYGSEIQGEGRIAMQDDQRLFGALYEMVRTGQDQTVEFARGDMGEYRGKQTYTMKMLGGPEEVAAKLLRRARGFVEHIDETGSNAKTRERLLKKLNSAGGLADPEVRAFLEKTTGNRLESLEGGFMAGRGGGAAVDFTIRQTMGDEAYYLRQVYGGAAAPGKVVGSDGLYVDFDKASQGYYTELTKNRYYLDAKDAVLHGKDAAAKRLLQQARADVLTSNPEAYRYLNTEDIDPTKQTFRPDAEKTYDAMILPYKLMANMMPSGKTMLEAVDKDLKKNILDKTSWKDQVKDEAKMLRGLRAKRKRGPGALQRAVGFGQQESAMSSIQRSLSHVERSLRALDKRVSGAGAQPQQSSDGQTLTSGGTK